MKNILTAVILMLVLSACSNEPLPDAAYKEEILSSTSVMPLPASGDDDDTVNNPPPLPGSPGSSTPPIGSPAPPVSFPVLYMCSDNATEKQKGTVTTADALKIVLAEPATGKALCTIDGPAIKDNIIDKKLLGALALDTECPGLAPGSYDMFLVPDSVTANFGLKSLISTRGGDDTPWVNFARKGVPVTVGATAPYSISTAYKLWVLFTSAQASKRLPAGICDVRASPLVIQIKRKSRESAPLVLTSPEEGVLFDILGKKAEHVPQRISWITTESAVDNMFLVLPDKDGKVRGIDQMFGDNTTGPDGAYADNGYEALRKYDGRRKNGKVKNPDGFISDKDKVFDDLRLWSDINGNGVAERNELRPLSKFNIKKIDLNYDENYSETDAHGNLILMKSVATGKNNRLHIVYDVWFKVP